MAQRFSTRPSLLLGIPPEQEWLAYCLDEALHVLLIGHDGRDARWADRFHRDDADGDLYGKIMADPRTGKPPSAQELGMLAAATDG
jgi:hypothetical protein